MNNSDRYQKKLLEGTLNEIIELCKGEEACGEGDYGDYFHNSESGFAEEIKDKCTEAISQLQEDFEWDCVTIGDLQETIKYQNKDSILVCYDEMTHTYTPVKDFEISTDGITLKV